MRLRCTLMLPPRLHAIPQTSFRHLPRERRRECLFSQGRFLSYDARRFDGVSDKIAFLPFIQCSQTHLTNEE